MTISTTIIVFFILLAILNVATLVAVFIFAATVYNKLSDIDAQLGVISNIDAYIRDINSMDDDDDFDGPISYTIFPNNQENEAKEFFDNLEEDDDDDDKPEPWQKDE